MSTNTKETKYIKTQVPDEERCLFTTNHGNRCRNPHLGNASRHCFLHEGRNQKVDEAEVLRYRNNCWRRMWTWRRATM